MHSHQAVVSYLSIYSQEADRAAENPESLHEQRDLPRLGGNRSRFCVQIQPQRIRRHPSPIKSEVSRDIGERLAFSVPVRNR